MIPIANNVDAAEAKYALDRAMFATEAWQLLAEGNPLAVVQRANCEFSVEWGKLIFAWWDDEHSQSWRVVAYEIDEAELQLQVTRGIAREMVMLTLRDEVRWREKIESENLPIDERRQVNAQTIARLLTAQFGKLIVRKVVAGADGKRVIPGRYTRLLMTLSNETILAIGANAYESQTEIDNVVAAGLIWLANFNQAGVGQIDDGQVRDEGRKAKRLWFCLPQRSSQTAIERLALLDASNLGARVECFEVNEQREELVPVQLATQNELLSAHPREVHWPDAESVKNPWRERILSLENLHGLNAHGLIEVRQITGRESYSINGLEFARLNAGEHARLTFGVAGWRGENDAAGFVPLSEANFHQLEKLVREIASYRSAKSADRHHPLYRLREEAWLESLLRRDIATLDAGLDGRYAYSQIPAWRGEERSVIDLLTVKQEFDSESQAERRLVVIEIKASEDAQLPLQGLDYWLRVEQARQRGEFNRRGLFAGIKLADRPALLYLVAPRLRFHRSFAIVARCLSPQIEAYQVGVNTNWREGIRVRTLERIN